jgi:hypothetical protein
MTNAWSFSVRVSRADFVIDGDLPALRARWGVDFVDADFDDE